MVYTLDEIKEKTSPVFAARNIPIAYLFGSYARGEADGDSDVDILIDSSGNRGLVSLGGILKSLKSALNKNVDMVTLGSLRSKINEDRGFIKENIERERVLIYEKKS